MQRKMLSTEIISSSLTELLLHRVSSVPCFPAFETKFCMVSKHPWRFSNKTSILLFHLAHRWEPGTWFPSLNALFALRHAPGPMANLTAASHQSGMNGSCLASANWTVCCLVRRKSISPPFLHLQPPSEQLTPNQRFQVHSHHGITWLCSGTEHHGTAWVQPGTSMCSSGLLLWFTHGQEQGELPKP